MDKINIQGGIPLAGEIFISGAKNAALPLMAASLLTEEKLTLSNVPHLADISTMTSLLTQHGVDFLLDASADYGGHQGDVIMLTAKEITCFEAPYDIVRKMRASVLVLGPLLARYGTAKVSLPGGCAIGTRPIDLHLQAFEAMGAKITLEEGYILAEAPKGLKGASISFETVSVGATENVLMAAALADGETVMHNAACEPEVQDLAHCLNQMGAQISGIGTPTLTIKGVSRLHGTEYRVISDRIEAGSYMAAAAITGGRLILKNTAPEILHSTIEVLQQAGTTINVTGNDIIVSRETDIQPIHAATLPYPGFATDMQAQIMTLMTLANGTSTIEETIFENRFMHVPELARMGALIEIKGHSATITGVKKLKGAELMATDLRASMSLVLAALAAEGETVINRVYHIDRGYERLEEKLSGCGAKIERVR